MAQRVICQSFVGRDAELTRLTEILDAASEGSGRLAVIGGDAGIGKTRLIEELCDRARMRGWLAVVGGCVDLGEAGLPYGPLVEAIRRLRAELGSPVVDDLLDPQGREREPHGVGLLLTASGRADVSASPGQLLEHVVGFLERLGTRMPTLAVFEDLHWADQSTRDLIAYLSRNLPPVPVVVVCTYRLDELHRRHPLRPLVAELHRNPTIEQIELGGMSRTELSALLKGIAGSAPADDDVDQVTLRSDGNPFYAEELVAAGIGRQLPETLREVILARVERLAAPTQTLLRKASVLGRDIRETHLAALTGLDADELADGLREALASQVLVGDLDGCRFRHALVQEAVYGELLPGERHRLHTAAAHAIEADTDLVNGPDHVRMALLVHHWGAANDLPRCFTASLHAAAAAEEVGALAEAAAHFERALDLWDLAPEPAASAGMDRAALLLRAASALSLSGLPQRAAGLADAALQELGPTQEAEARAAVLERLGRYRWVAGQQADSIACYEQAVALLGDRPPSETKALVMAALGQSLMLRSQLERAEQTLRAAIEVAASVGSRAVEGQALCSLGPVLGDLGCIDEAVAAFERALMIAEAEQSDEDLGRARVNLSAVLYWAGRCDEAVAVAKAGLEHAGRAGLLRSYGRTLATNGGQALLRLGRWDEARELLTQGGARAGSSRDIGESGVLAVHGTIATRQGDWMHAATHLDLALERTANSEDIMWRGGALAAAVELAAAQGRLDDARRLATEAAELAAAADSPTDGMPAYAAALRVEADRAELAAASSSRGAERSAESRSSADRLFARARRLAELPGELGGVLLPEPAAWLATVEAEHDRAQGRSNPDRWSEVAEHWDALGYPYHVAEARYREAEAVLHARGSRERAVNALGVAAAISDQLGAEPLAGRIRLLARQARLDLCETTARPDAEPDPLADMGLTTREAEVLSLVADGLTNRRIGERLYISEKTASVHVTNLLRKLGVTSRTEAATVAHRLGAAGTP